VLRERFKQGRNRFTKDPKGYAEILSRYVSFMEARGGRDTKPNIQGKIRSMFELSAASV
jgi:hypothetical protein